MDEQAINYNSKATQSSNDCTYPLYGCTDSRYSQYNSGATTDDGSCQLVDCTDSTAVNYNSLATAQLYPIRWPETNCVYAPPPSLPPPSPPPSPSPLSLVAAASAAENPDAWSSNDTMVVAVAAALVSIAVVGLVALFFLCWPALKRRYFSEPDSPKGGDSPAERTDKSPSDEGDPEPDVPAGAASPEPSDAEPPPLFPSVAALQDHAQVVDLSSLLAYTRKELAELVEKSGVTGRGPTPWKAKEGTVAV
mmetsp:Transcript_10538/g.34537  ORF Transcript_10538/g.34537 Transcript_10538/m.34537 type:complete len:250 (+) Transcript_10538:1-750(+)